MTAKRFTYMIDRVFDLWGVYDNNEKVICLVRNSDAKDLCDLLNALHEEKEELIDALNQRTEQCDKLHEENQRLQLELDKDILFNPSRHSKSVRMDFLERYSELVNYETKVKETLQGHYDFARNKKKNCKENDLICFHCYRVLKASIEEIADELGVDLE